jgi:hypothetical protein
MTALIKRRDLHSKMVQALWNLAAAAVRKPFRASDASA